MSKSVIITYPKSIVNKPIITRLIRRHDVELNILHAQISQKFGEMFVIVDGDDNEISNFISDIESEGAIIVHPKKNIHRNEKLCTHCGACVGHCQFDAIYIDDSSKEIIFDRDNCTGCIQCMKACIYKAISVNSQLETTRAK